jgi:acetolactate synthase-1/2/3 large subunit
MSEQIAGHLLVECLVAQGVTHAFGVPGESYLAALDGFHAYRDRIRFVINRQEGGAAYMAEAHGKLTNRPGVCFVTRGPGATNASVGVHTAFQDSTPMVLFVGDVAANSAIAKPSRSWITAASSAPAPAAWPSGWSASTTRSASPNT